LQLPTKLSIASVLLLYSLAVVGQESIIPQNLTTKEAPTPIYQKVEVILNEPEDIGKIASMGIDLRCGVDLRRESDYHIVTIEINENQHQQIKNSGLSTKILINNLSQFYSHRATKDLPEAKASLEKLKVASANMRSQISQDMGCLENNYPVPQNFNLGSMGGFPTYQELLNDLDKMANLYPNLITLKTSASLSGITTDQGNEVFYVKVSDNPNIDENEAELLYTGLHHAREPMSMVNLQYYLWYLLENYNTDSSVKRIVDNTELYFIPVLNPDGYLYNESTNPNGGGFWRKNRRSNADGSIGVDLNRNYGYNWGYDNTGSSPTSSSDIYRGTGPFSEAETQIIKEFSENRTFVNVFNNHSYTNLLIRPWGYDYSAPADGLLFDELGEHLCWHSRYNYGGSEIIYPANGVSDDWFYGETTSKNKSLSWTPEIGAVSDGFWPSSSRIQVLCEKHLRLSLVLAETATNHGLFNDLTSYNLNSLTPTLDFNVQHLSLTSGAFTISVSSTDPNVMSIANPAMSTSVLTDIDNETVSTAISLSPSTPPKTPISFVVTLNNGVYDIYSTTITKMYMPNAMFSDDCNTMANWTSTSWDVDSSTGYLGSGSITDSPTGNSTNGTKTITMTNPIDFSAVQNPTLEYYSKWEIAKLLSYAQLEVSTDGSNWTTLCGEYMKKGVSNNDFTNGNSDQPAGEPIYDGYQESFVREQFNLSAYSGFPSVYFRFTFLGDTNASQLDGFWFDDFSIFDDVDLCPLVIIENTGSIINNSQSAVNSIETNGTVAIGSNLSYNAGDLVQLNSGFNSPIGSSFEAFILACQ